MCVCACVGVRACVCVRFKPVPGVCGNRECVCVWVCAFLHFYFFLGCMHVFWQCVCVCACVSGNS